jgi:hypothetical protein
MSRTSTLPKRLQPMLATLTDGPFDDAGWVFEDKYDGFRMIAKIEGGKVTLYSRNGKIISQSYIEVATSRVQRRAAGDMNALHVPSLQRTRRIDDGIDTCEDWPPRGSIRRLRNIERDVARVLHVRFVTRQQYAVMSFSVKPCVDRRSNKARAANEKDAH